MRWSTQGLLCGILVFLCSCSAMKHVPEDKYLLKDVEVNVKKSVVNKDELDDYIKQKPNKKILGFKFHLFLYNLPDPQKDTRIAQYFRKIGEEPVLWNSYLTIKTREQLIQYLKNKGFYNAEVHDTTILKKNKAYVKYNIEPHDPYVVNEVSYVFEDTTIKRFIFSDTVNTFLSEGMIFDVDLLLKERERIEDLLQNKGFYNFNKEYIFFNVDSALSGNKVDLEMVFKKYVSREDDFYLSGKHHRYKINNVFVIMDYDPKKAISYGDRYLSRMDTFKYDSIFFLHENEPEINPGILTQSNYIIPGGFYSLEDVELTKRHLSSLRAFRSISINFYEVGSNKYYSPIKQLNCFIQLTPLVPQHYQIEIAGTNSSGNLGAAGNLMFQHKNLFGNTEIFDIRLRGSAETLIRQVNEELNNTVELGIETRLNLPKFLLPFKTENFIRKFSPKTTFSLSFNFRDRPHYYKRTLANLSFGYHWKGNRFVTHLVNPVKLNLVSLQDTTARFNAEIGNNQYFRSTYEPRLITLSDYSFIYTNQDIKRNRDFVYFRYNLELAGNLLSAYYKTFKGHGQEEPYEFFNTEYSQYIKTEFDFRYYNIVDDYKSIVYRVFAGIAYPYGNSISIPFEKKYFAGGANSIRAWNPRFLGPGAANDTIKNFLTGLSDIKLEMNMEYRFDLFWKIEGALFVDAGNVWSIRGIDDRPGAKFNFKDFYKDIAVGTGVGARFDFDYFLIRLDLGLKTYNPMDLFDEDGKRIPRELQDDPVKKWIFQHDRLTLKDWTLQFAIAYPF